MIVEVEGQSRLQALIVAFHPTLTESLTPVTKWLNPLSCADTKVRSVYLSAALVA